MTSDLKEGVMRVVKERNRREDERDFQTFCDQLLSLPPNLEFMPKANFVADVELQPWRWLSLGIDLLQSRKVTRHVQLADGIQGPPISSYLPYPVFQMATEIFLKGMWLYQHQDCRAIADSSYVDLGIRHNYLQKLGPRGLGHDLLKIVDTLRLVPDYSGQADTLRFLDLVERITRRFYFPPYTADKRTRWADSRYPKRVYDDQAHDAHAETFQSYPRAEWIEKLFLAMEADARRIWN